jgi:hypothetical protein
MENLTALQSAMRAIEKIDSSFFNVNTSKGRNFLEKMNIFLEIEKQQIIDAYKADLHPCSDEDAEQYYNQTFKN